MTLKFNALVPPFDQTVSATTVEKAEGVPLEIPAGKTYEVPANSQWFWKENISVQGTLNIQGRFDELGAPGTLGELGTKKHHELESFDEFDDHAQYAKLVGRQNIQSLSGGTEGGGVLNLLGSASGVGNSVHIKSKEGVINPSLTVNETIVQAIGTLTTGKLSAETEVETPLIFLASTPTAGKLHIGRFALGEPNTPAKIKSTRKEYGALKGKVAWARLEVEAGKGTQKIVGISTVELQEGEAYWLTNIGAETIALVSESVEETKTEFQFKLSVAEIEIKANQSVMIAYDNKSSKWRVLAGPSG